MNERRSARTKYFPISLTTRFDSTIARKSGATPLPYRPGIEASSALISLIS